MIEKSPEGTMRFNPKYLKFSWALADAQERREHGPTPDMRLAPFVTKEVVSDSVQRILDEG